jgi:protein-tyrosine-phosphatase
MLSQALQEMGFADYWLVRSAGTWATPGQPALPAAVSAARRRGLDLSGHRSTRVSRELISEYDLILVMQASHREALLTEFPDLAEHIHLFSDVLEHRSYDIPDSCETEQNVWDISGELNDLIRNGLDRICLLSTQLRDMRLRFEQ